VGPRASLGALKKTNLIHQPGIEPQFHSLQSLAYSLQLSCPGTIACEDIL